MKQRITFIVEIEVERPIPWQHNDLGDVLRPNIKEAILNLNKHWSVAGAGGKINRVEVVYLPVLLP